MTDVEPQQAALVVLRNIALHDLKMVATKKHIYEKLLSNPLLKDPATRLLDVLEGRRCGFEN